MKKILLPVSLVFVLVNALLLVFAKKLQAKGVDTDLAIGGNIVLYLATMLSAWLNYQALHTKSAPGMMRNVMGGFMVKFFIIAIAAFIYIIIKKDVNTAGLFVCMGLYFVYTFFSTRNVLKQQPKKEQDAERKTTP